MVLVAVTAVVFLFNVPFGYWRANTRKLTPQWFAAVHAPVLPVVALRSLSHLPWELGTLAPVVIAFFLGQLAGQHIRQVLAPRLPLRASSCLIWDVARNVRLRLAQTP